MATTTGAGRRRAREAPLVEGPEGGLGRWRAGENSVGGRRIGEIAPADITAGLDVALGKAVVDWDGEPVYVSCVCDEVLEQWKAEKMPVDSRIVKVRTKHTMRCRLFTDAYADVTQQGYGDWPIKGPRTAQW